MRAGIRGERVGGGAGSEREAAKSKGVRAAFATEITTHLLKQYTPIYCSRQIQEVEDV